VTRLITALSEEWFRQAIAWWHQARGRMVIFDRHFACDHRAAALAAPMGRRPWTGRLHGFVLDRLYPRPDLVICLDGPVETLYGRKPEGTLEQRAELRDAYRRLAEVMPRFALVDASRPEDEVVESVKAIVERADTEGESGGPAVDRATERLVR
jgi:thymidylate kinase